MKKPPKAAGWAVYQIAARGHEPVVRAVCEQREWPAIHEAGEGRCTLIRGCITNEGEAERLARGTSGDPVPTRPIPRWLKKPGT